MSYRVIFTPEAEEQLAALYRYIAEAASSYIAAQYTEAIVSFCESLRTFPYRGTMRDDVRPGLRITNYKKRAVIAFHVDAEVVSKSSAITVVATKKIVKSIIAVAKTFNFDFFKVLIHVLFNTYIPHLSQTVTC